MKNEQYNEELRAQDEKFNIQDEKEWQSFKKNVSNRNFLLISVVLILMVIGFAVGFSLRYYAKNNSPIASSTAVSSETTAQEQTSNEDSCNIAGINLHGSMVTYNPKEDLNDSGNLKVDETASEDVYFAVKNAEKKENIKAIIVEIDSSGGDPTAAEEVEKVLKNSTKPVIAYIRSVGTSAAYWAATGAGRIFALPTSQVGSIAVNGSYLDKTKYNQEEGYTFNDLTTGKFKNTTNSDKPLTAEERTLVMKDLYEVHDLFVKTVAENRNLDINKVKELANGWAYTGTDALKLGLVDEFGGLDEVENYLEKNVLNNEKADICW